MRDDLDHLGVLIGDPGAGRIIALGTSSVFHDASLLRTFWNLDGASLDSGLQAHLYTRPDDTFVIQVPVGAHDPARRLGVALDAGCSVWRRLTGARLASSSSRVLLARGSTGTTTDHTGAGPASTTWVDGSLLDGLQAAWTRRQGAVLAFVLDSTLLARLGINPAADSDLARRARTVTRLMDKNHAMSLLAAHGVDCARTYVFDARQAAAGLADLPTDAGARYVFKPAGGAAGIGVFTGGGAGADPATLADHVRELCERGRLPRRFQVQEFLPGPALGASVWLDGDGGCRVFEIHEQVLDAAARCVGARWTRSAHARLEPEVTRIGRAVSAAVGVRLLVGIDLVGGRVVEVNPRLTASAPIAHLLRRADTLDDALAGRGIERIDIDTRVPISFAAMSDGRLEAAVERVRTQYATLVLPQGLNPFGSTRVAFVNDDQARSARSAFVRLVA